MLAGSAGRPAGGGTYSRLDGDFRCIAVGAGKIGQIAASGEPLVAKSLRGDEEWLANPGWIARQGVRAFVGFPLTANDRVHGVVAIFARTSPTDSDLDDLRLIADLTAIRAHHLQREHEHNARDRSPVATPARIEADRAIVTRADLRAMERQTIEAALARTGGKVFGADGAAALLGMKPTTLASRIKALDVLKAGRSDT